MDIGQVQDFVDESIEKNKKWDRILLMGGEPTLHSDILSIFGILSEYNEYNPGCKIILISNHYGSLVNQILSQVPKWMGIAGVHKSHDFNPENYSNITKAPIDAGYTKHSDYSGTCRWQGRCGTALSAYGYYICAMASAIDRIAGFDLGLGRLRI